MKTTAQILNDRLIDLKNRINVFLNNYSTIKRIIYPEDGIISMDGDFGFDKLPTEAVSLQDKIYKDFNVLTEIIEVLIIDSLEKHKNVFKFDKETILSYIQQTKRTWKKSIDEVVGDNNSKFRNIEDILTVLFPNVDLKPILIPDTNALYYNTEIEDWVFTDFNKFTIILTPSVLKDLDKHKIEHRNESIKTKAEKLINKIKEYRRRGKLTDGVQIRRDFIDLMSVATEPDFNKTLKWLDKENEDDRLIAEYIEIMRRFCNRPVLLVTRDINLQNKCDSADLAYIEP